MKTLSDARKSTKNTHTPNDQRRKEKTVTSALNAMLNVSLFKRKTFINQAEFHTFDWFECRVHVYGQQEQQHRRDARD